VVSEVVGSEAPGERKDRRFEPRRRPRIGVSDQRIAAEKRSDHRAARIRRRHDRQGDPRHRCQRQGRRSDAASAGGRVLRANENNRTRARARKARRRRRPQRHRAGRQHARARFQQLRRALFQSGDRRWPLPERSRRPRDGCGLGIGAARRDQSRNRNASGSERAQHDWSRLRPPQRRDSDRQCAFRRVVRRRGRQRRRPGRAGCPGPSLCEGTNPSGRCCSSRAAVITAAG
jgi:hypothetical protein